MTKRIIECSVKDEYILGSGVPVGAAGSHDDVILRIAFNEMWYGLEIYAVFFNALATEWTHIMLEPSMLKSFAPGESMVYDVPIPALAKKIPGRMQLTLIGYSIVDGSKEDVATCTEEAFFRVLPSGYTPLEDYSVSPTIAQQLLTAINSLDKKKISIEDLEKAVNDALTEAKASGLFDGADGKSAYEYAVEGGFEGTEEDFYDKLVNGGGGNGFSGKWEDIIGKPIIPTKVSMLENDLNFSTKQNAETYTTNAVGVHNISTTSHNDIRLLIARLSERLNTFLNSDDTTLDEAKELVAYIKENRSLIDSITISKVNVADIVDDLVTNANDKPLSAKQGVVLKALIDGIVIPTLLSQLAEDATHRTVTDVEKQTWNSKSDFSGKYSDLKDKPTIPEVPTKVSAFENDAEYLTHFEETDPTVPEWAKQPTKPTYKKSEVGLDNVDNVRQYSADNEPPYPVISVNGKTGKVTLSATDVGAEESGAASSAVSTHDTATDSHNDIRLLVFGLSERVKALLNSDDTTLDETKEIVAYIKANKALIDSITTSKVNVADIINNLTTNVTNKPLSAAQGVVIKALIDAKLDSSKLTEAINTALAEAKASGEFDGEDGDPGAEGRGIKSITRTSGNGAAGTTDTYTITYTDNTTSTFTVYNGEDGTDGERGTGILPTTTGIASYTTTTNGVTPAYRISLSTLKTQSKVSEVLVGDQVRYSYYLYPVITLDADYAYLGTRVSIRGSGGTSVTVSSVSESTESGGSNVVTFSDGKTLTVKNGKDGKTPVAGTDFFTPADKAEMVNSVISALPKYAGEVS